jgi:hypothetical protein
VNNQRISEIPTSDKSDELGHVVVRRSDIAVERLSDVVHAKDEVICRRDRVRPSNEIDVLEQGHNVLRAGVFDSPVKARE